MNVRHHRMRHGHRDKYGDEAPALLVKQAQPPQRVPLDEPAGDAGPAGAPPGPDAPGGGPAAGPGDPFHTGEPEEQGPMGPEGPGGLEPVEPGLGEDPLLRPRAPGPEPARTEVNIDRDTGAVDIDMGALSIKVAARAKVIDSDSPLHNQTVYVYEDTVKESAYGGEIVQVKGPDGKTTWINWDSLSDDVTAKVAGDSGSKKPRSDEWNALFESEAPDYEDDPLHDDTHDNPLATPRHRRTPPEFDVKFSCESEERASALAYSLNATYGLSCDLSGKQVTASGVYNPIALMNEISGWAIDSEVVGEDLTQYVPGMKVAVLRDFPDVNYFFNRERPALAKIVGTEGDEVILEHDAWGQFLASTDELGPKGAFYG